MGAESRILPPPLKPGATVEHGVSPTFERGRTGLAFVLSAERARTKAEFAKRREKFFTVIEGERQLDLDHADIQRVANYGNELFDNKRVGEDGLPYGLRVRAKDRNEGRLDHLSEMSFQDRVAHLKENPEIALKKGTKEWLLARDYLKATAGQEQWGDALFYHDAPLLVEGVLASELDDRVELAQGIVEDLACAFYMNGGMIPNGTSQKLNKQSQPPSLAQMGWMVYDAMQDESPQKADENLTWLGTVMEVAEEEFTSYWKNKIHSVEGSNLVTPGDSDTGAHDSSERETGRDMTTEYDDRAHDHFDVNINAKLVGYTRKIAQYKRLIHKEDEADKWDFLGDVMRDEMRVVHFNGESYVAFDARETGKQSQVMALTGYLALTEAIPTDEQASIMVPNLERFRGPYGFSHILPESLHPYPAPDMIQVFPDGLQPTVRHIYRDRQWGDMRAEEKDNEQKNIPEWAIEIYEIVKGLKRYNFVDEAIDITEDWLLASTEYFNKHGTLPEKRNVITGENGHGVEYPQQVDFGWSFALYIWMLKELPRLYAQRNMQKAQRSNGRRTLSTLEAMSDATG